MSDKARYGISVALGWSAGAILVAFLAATDAFGSPWVIPVGFALTFGTTFAATEILRD